MHIGDGGDVRILRSPFVDDVLQLSELIRRDDVLAKISRLSFQTAIRLSQRRRTLAEALGDPVIVDHHAAQSRKHDHVERIDHRARTGRDGVGGGGLRHLPVLGHEPVVGAGGGRPECRSGSMMAPT